MKLLLILSIFIMANAQDKVIKHRSKTLITTGEIHANNVKAIVANNGWLFWGGGGNGFVTPSPVFENNPDNFGTVFFSGLWFVGRVDGELKAAVSYYATDFIPGNWDDYQVDSIANGAEHPDNIVYYHYSETHINYLKSLLNSGNSELDERINDFASSELINAQTFNTLWPKAIAQGAPENPPGDVAAFAIFHDADIEHRENNGLNRTNEPLNIQVRQLVYSYRAVNAVNNAVFVKVQVINKNTSPIENFYTTIMLDPDIGIYTDDLVGSDPDLELGYAYSALEKDVQYTDILGLDPPAVGAILLQGFLIDSVGHTAYKVTGDTEIYTNEINQFAKYLSFESIENKYVQKLSGVFSLEDGDETSDVEDFYNIVQNRFLKGGYNWQQREALNSGLADSSNVNWMYSGNPAQGSGWIDKNPNDKRYVLNMNPTTLAVSNNLENFNDSGYNELLFAVYTSFGASNLSSVSKLKFDSYDIQQKFGFAFDNFAIKNPAPELSYNSNDTLIRLLWNPITEKVNSELVFTEENLENGYKFEGYQIVQFKNEDRTEFIEIEAQDIKNNISYIFNNALSEISGDVFRDLAVKGKDESISYFIDIEKDYYSNKPLLTNNKYYYGIRAYYYHPNPPNQKSFAKFGEWSSFDKFISTKKIDLGTELSSEFGQEIEFENLSDFGDGKAIVTVLNPYQVTGNSYKIKFKVFEENTLFTGYLNDTIPVNTLGWYLEKDEQQVSSLMPQTTSQKGYSSKYIPQYPLLYEGLKIIVTGPPVDFKNFTVVANANGLLDPADMGAFAFNGFPSYNGTDSPDRSRQQENGSTWGIHISTDWTSGAFYHDFISDVGKYMGGHIDSPAGQLAGGTGIHHAVPNDYEIRFTANGGKAMMRDDSLRFVVDVPFELWNIGLVASDTSDDYRMVPFFRDRDANHEFNFIADDHAVSGGDNDPATEGIFFLDPTDKSPGHVGYDAIVAAATADAVNNWVNTITEFPYAYNSPLHTVGFNSIGLVNWNGGDVTDPTFPANVDALMPEEGTIFRISTAKVNSESTVLSFKAPDAPLLYDTKLAKSQFKENLTVFPNPFYVAQSNQTNVNDTYVTFANLPVIENNESVDIRIYSINGNLVKNIKYTGQSTLQRWELRNNSNRKINSGLYIAVVSYGNVTVIKKILIFV